MPVVGVGESAFRNSLTLTSMTLGSNVVSIGHSAFSGCFNLAVVFLPNSVTDIGAFAFYGTALAAVTLPEGVAAIGSQAFLNCARLGGIEVSASNAFYRSSNGVLFDKSATHLLQYPGGKSGPYAIPATVSQIGDYAFSACTGLTSVLIPDSVRRIGNDAFDNCTAMTNVVMGTNVAEIGAFAFWNCARLPAIRLPASVTTVQALAFYACSALTGISVDAGNPVYTATNGVLFDKTLTHLLQYPGGKAGPYTLPASVTNIADHAFDGCALLTDVTLGPNLVRIGDYAFCGCSGLSGINVPPSVRHIGAHAFDGCTQLARLFFLGDAPEVGPHAFDLATNMTLYYLPSGAGWDLLAADWPAVAWNPRVSPDAPVGPGSSGFEFTIAGSTGLTVAVECSNDLEQPAWVNLGTRVLADGTCRFIDVQWSFDRARYYRFRTP